MKIYQLLTTLIILGSTAISQTTKEAYYDFSWKACDPEKACYYSIVEKTDSGWLRRDYYVQAKRLQMLALFEDEACDIPNGISEYYFANGYPSTIGSMKHGKRQGICRSYHSNGMIADSAFYQNGQVVDKRFRWHRNGYMSDSIARVNDSMHVQVGWFDDGNPAYAGYLLNGKEQGKWKYFHYNREISAVELYNNGKLQSATYFSDKGVQLTDTTGVNREAQFKGGENAWRRYLEKNFVWPYGLRFTTPGAVTIGVDFVIDENGKVSDAAVGVPFHEQFDNAVLKLISKGPAWEPAVAHNRKVKAWRRQPMTFAQPD